MDQDPRLARAGAGQYQDAGLFSVVGDNALLDGILQVFHNGPPRLRRGLACNFLVAGGQPAAQKILLLQAEIVHDESQCVGHGLQAALDVLRHDVNLEHLVLVMELERCEVGVSEAALFLTQTDGHGGAEYGQSLIEADDFLFVQPQQGTVQQSFGIPDRRSLTPGQTGSRSTAWPRVVSANRSVPRLPEGRLSSRWFSSTRAAARRRSAVSISAAHSR